MEVVAAVGVALGLPLQSAFAGQVGVVMALQRQLVAVEGRPLACVPALPPDGVEEGLEGAGPVAVDLEGPVV